MKTIISWNYSSDTSAVLQTFNLGLSKTVHKKKIIITMGNDFNEYYNRDNDKK